MERDEHEHAEAHDDGGVVAKLVNSKRRFLAFLEPRVGSRDAAEEILQAAFARTVERADEIRDDEKAVAWFYRLLRNALIDRHRREEARGRMLERQANEERLREQRPTTPTRSASSARASKSCSRR